MEFLILQPENKRLKMSQIQCADDDDASFKLMQDAVDGHFELCTYLFEGLPSNVDAWCNEEGLFRTDLVPILAYTMPGQKTGEYGLIKGNILFTAHNKKGETLGLSQSQKKDIYDCLEAMPSGYIVADNNYYPVIVKQ